jgi:hypothetical protein
MKKALQRIAIIPVMIAALWAADTRGAQRISIDADYPGGNILVEKIDGDIVELQQDLRDTEGWWFYWNFRVTGAAGRTLTFRFGDRSPIGVHGPAVSTDEGRNWKWLGAESVKDASFSYAFPTNAGAVRFCFAIPYLEADLREFLKAHAGNRHLKVEELAVSQKGRPIERLHVGRLDGNPRHRVALTARHHACESIASFSLEGILAAVLSDTADGRWFRQHVEILAVPFMDKDGVEDGDQGKNRKPHDHNRDYGQKSIYPSVIALKKFVPDWSQGRLWLFMDMHCPNFRGGGDNPGSNERIFFARGPDSDQMSELDKFSRILEEVQTGPLKYSARYNLPWGQKWNKTAPGQIRTSRSWFAIQPGILWAATIEIPYANVGGPEPVSADGARALGRDLAAAIRRYLESQEQDSAKLP